MPLRDDIKKAWSKGQKKKDPRKVPLGTKNSKLEQAKRDVDSRRRRKQIEEELEKAGG